MDRWRLIPLLLVLLVSTNANAAVVVVQQYVSNNDVTLARLNSNMNAIVNQVNGNLEGNGGINIKAGSITSTELNTTVSTITRWADSFNNYTVSGQLPATSASLASDISAGVSYVSGYRVATAATNHTYTASKDTYVYINKGGYFVYSEVANGAAAPSTPADSLLLAVAITNGTAITSVTDSRTLSIQITTTTTNFPSNFRDQGYVSRDTVTTIHAEPGNLSIGNTIYSRTADTSTKSIATGTNWIEASVPSTNTGFYVYAYNDSGSSWDIKFSSADPVYSDTSSNTGGILRYYTTGGTNYRAIGWAYKSADNVQTYHYSNFNDGLVYDTIEFNDSTVVSTASTSFVNDIAVPKQQFYTTGNPIRITYSAAMANAGSDFSALGIMIDGVDVAETERWSGVNNNTITNNMGVVTIYQGVLSRGFHTMNGRFYAKSSTSYINKRRIIIEQL